MKKILITFLSLVVIVLVLSFIIIYLTNNKNPKNVSEFSSPFVARENEIALLIVGKFDMSSEEIKDELDVSKLHKITTLDSVEEFNKSHSGWNLEKSPAFILFDTKEPIYTTYSYEELKNYVNSKFK